MYKIYGKRLLAYILDIIIVSIILWVISLLFSDSNKANELNQQLNNINENFINKSISFKKYINQYASINYQIDKIMLFQNILNYLIMLTYFVVIPYFNKGKTIALQLFHLKIERKDYQNLTLIDLLLRSFIVNGLFYFLFPLTFIYIMKDVVYFTVLSILGLIQIILVFISVFMIKYNYKQGGLQDLVSKTQIVRTKM